MILTDFLAATFRNIFSPRGHGIGRLLASGCASVLLISMFAVLRGTENKVENVQTSVLASYPTILTADELGEDELARLAANLDFTGDEGNVMQVLYELKPAVYAYSDAEVRPASFSEKANWTEMPDEERLLEDRFALVSGRRPAAFDEAALLLNVNGEVDRSCLASLGIAEETDVSAWTYLSYTMLTLRLLLPSDAYALTAQNTWTDMSNDEEYMRATIAAATPIKIVGVLQPVSSSAGEFDVGGVVYTGALTSWLRNAVKNSAVATAQREDPTKNILSGEPFVKQDGMPEDEWITAGLKKYIRSLSPAGAAVFYRDLMQSDAPEDAAEALCLKLESFSPDYRKTLYETYIGDPESVTTYEENMEAFGLTAADKVAEVRIFSDTFSDRQRAIEQMERYSTAVSSNGETRDVVNLGEQLTASLTDFSTVVRAGALMMCGLMVFFPGFVIVRSRREEAFELYDRGASPFLVWCVFTAEAFFIGLVGSALGAVAIMLFIQYYGGAPGGVICAIEYKSAFTLALFITACAWLGSAIAGLTIKIGRLDEPGFFEAEFQEEDPYSTSYR